MEADAVAVENTEFQIISGSFLKKGVMKLGILLMIQNMSLLLEISKC